MDFAGARLIAAGVVRDLVIDDSVEVFADVAAEIAFGDLQMIEVGEHLHVGRVDGTKDADGRITAVKAMPLVIDADIHRLEDQGDIVPLGDGGAAAESSNNIVMHLLLGHALNV